MTTLSIFYTQEVSNFSFFAKLHLAYRRSVTQNALRALSNRQLADIGLCHYNITDFVNESVR